MWLYITSICVLLITVLLVMNSSEYFVAPMGGNIFNDEILREFVRNKKSQRDEKYSPGYEYPQQPMYYENAPKSDGMYDLEDVSRMGLGGFLHADDEGSVDHNNNF